MQRKPTVQGRQITFTDQLRSRFNGILERIAEVPIHLGLSPNTITILGVVGSFFCAIFLAQGFFLIGGIILFFIASFDALDGAVARLTDACCPYGAFLDAVCDRYFETFIFGGLVVHYLRTQDTFMAGVIFLASTGSILVSYTRAKAESVGFEVKRGLLTRVERFLILIPSLVLGFPRIGIGILAIFTHFTALQRIYLVRCQAHPR